MPVRVQFLRLQAAAGHLHRLGCHAAECRQIDVSPQCHLCQHCSDAIGASTPSGQTQLPTAHQLCRGETDMLQEAASGPPASCDSRTEGQQPRGSIRHPLHDAVLPAHSMLPEDGLVHAHPPYYGVPGGKCCSGRNAGPMVGLASRSGCIQVCRPWTASEGPLTRAAADLGGQQTDQTLQAQRALDLWQQKILPTSIPVDMTRSITSTLSWAISGLAPKAFPQRSRLLARWVLPCSSVPQLRRWSRAAHVSRTPTSCSCCQPVQSMFL